MNGADNTSKMFECFISKIEIVYAILIAWGFAHIAKTFRLNWEYLQYLFVCALVLMRFFFASSHNLAAIAKTTENRPFWQRFLFFWDVPMLIAHSFIYYRMCEAEGISFLGIPEFYVIFYLFLLPLNVIWLLSIGIRMHSFNQKLYVRFVMWSRNNYVHVGIFAILFLLHVYSIIDLSEEHKFLLFIFALTNCIIDFIFTAPDYLGFRDIIETVSS